SMCGNAERAQGLARRHAEEDVYRELRQRIKAWSRSLAQCYNKMADGLEKGQDGQSYLKSDKKCDSMVRKSVFTDSAADHFPQLGFLMDRHFDHIYTDRKTHKYDDPKVRYPNFDRMLQDL
ncbi:hypothetical protein, partial [Helicobacter labacensis]|uniref:hypothetical protein n=1 Tax=Helicobacter labacensis TaxID=2316079 RepID=UPI0013CE0D14